MPEKQPHRGCPEKQHYGEKFCTGRYTIELVNAGDQTILSGAAVVVGSMVAVPLPIFLPVRR